MEFKRAFRRDVSIVPTANSMAIVHVGCCTRAYPMDKTGIDDLCEDLREYLKNDNAVARQYHAESKHDDRPEYVGNEVEEETYPAPPARGSL